MEWLPCGPGVSLLIQHPDVMLSRTGRRALGGLWARAAAECNLHAAGLATQPGHEAEEEPWTLHEAPARPFSSGDSRAAAERAVDLDAMVMKTLQRHFLGAAADGAGQELAERAAMHEEAPPAEGSAMAAGMEAYAARTRVEWAVANNMERTLAKMEKAKMKAQREQRARLGLQPEPKPKPKPKPRAKLPSKV